MSITVNETRRTKPTAVYPNRGLKRIEQGAWNCRHISFSFSYTTVSPETNDGEMPQHVREEHKHDWGVDELVQEGTEEGRAARVPVAVGNHPHPEDRTSSEHEAHSDENVERIHEELERCRENNPNLFENEAKKGHVDTENKTVHVNGL